MADMPDFDFDPVDGVENTTTYVNKPATGAVARENIQRGMNQIKTFLNNTVKILFNAHTAEKVFHAGSFTRDAATAGTQPIAGLGFSPKVVILFASINDTANQMSEGFSVNGIGNFMLRNTGNYIANSFAVGGTLCISILKTASDSTNATVSSFDADGFTLAWAKVGAGATGTISVAYLALSHY